MDYVFDSSFIAQLIVPNEKIHHQSSAYINIKDDALKYTSQLFWYEISNFFKNLLRCKHYTTEEVFGFFNPLSALGLKTDFDTGAEYSKKIFRLCNEYNLTSYNAAYLELAERKRAILCTLDKELIAAAKKHGITVLDMV